MVVGIVCVREFIEFVVVFSSAFFEENMGSTRKWYLMDGSLWRNNKTIIAVLFYTSNAYNWKAIEWKTSFDLIISIGRKKTAWDGLCDSESRGERERDKERKLFKKKNKLTTKWLHEQALTIQWMEWITRRKRKKKNTHEPIICASYTIEAKSKNWDFFYVLGFSFLSGVLTMCECIVCVVVIQYINWKIWGERE